MPDVKPEQVTTALAEHTSPSGDGGRRFASGLRYSETEAEAIVSACLSLGVPVSDAFTSALLITVADRLTTLERIVFGDVR